MGRRVLLLGWQLPPGRGSGVYRIRAWANALAARGWEVDVLTVRREFYAALNGELDVALERTLDPRLRLHRFRFPHEHLVQDVAGMSRLHAEFPLLHARAYKRAARTLFPELYGTALPFLLAAGLRVAARRRPHVVVATGNPYTQLGAAHLLGRALQVPYVVDYHDSWTLNQFAEADAFSRDQPEWRWERRIVEGAALTVTVNDPLAGWYREQYPSAAARVRVVENGWADDVVPPAAYRPVDGPVRFGYVGTIRGDLPLEPFLDGWQRARANPAMAGATFDFYGYLGFFAWNAEPIRRRLETGVEGVTYRGPVSQTALTATYEGLDVLGMLTPSSRFVTAGKVYDYMASGRTVLGVHDARNDSTRAFAGYPLFVGSGSTDPDDVAKALVGAAEAARAATPEQHAAAVALARRHTWEEHLAPVLDELPGIARG